MNTALLLAAQQQQGGGLGMIVMMVAFFVIMWLFMIRPQQKKQKEIRAFQNSLSEGKHVVTGGGVHGTVRRIDMEKNVIDLEIARGVVITVDRNFVYADAQSQQADVKK